MHYSAETTSAHQRPHGRRRVAERASESPFTEEVFGVAIRTATWTSIVFAIVLTLGSCVPLGPVGTSDITIKEPWSRPAMAGGNGAAFMTITNATGQDDRVVSAETSVAAMVELHETIQQDGVMSMIHQPEGFLLPAGEILELKPGGKHVMLMGLANPLEPGQTYQLTLNLEKAGPIVVDVTVSGQ
jgi:hypothetical protein